VTDWPTSDWTYNDVRSEFPDAEFPEPRSLGFVRAGRWGCGCVQRPCTSGSDGTTQVYVASCLLYVCFMFALSSKRGIKFNLFRKVYKSSSYHLSSVYSVRCVRAFTL